MSGKKIKAARAEARRIEGVVDKQARRLRRAPWYTQPFPRWRQRWLQRWDREHREGLRAATKRMTHALCRLYR
jgi:hypothetical protein